MDSDLMIRIWAIRAGRENEAQDLFLKAGRIALLDPGLGDLRKLPQHRDAFVEAYRKLRPNDSKVSVSGTGGQFFRFLYEMKTGDFVLYPPTKEKVIHLGRVAGAYLFSPDTNPQFPHQVPVTWLMSFSTEDLSVVAKREIGAARTFFVLKKSRREIQQILKRGASS